MGEDFHAAELRGPAVRNQPRKTADSVVIRDNPEQSDSNNGTSVSDVSEQRRGVMETRERK